MMGISDFKKNSILQVPNDHQMAYNLLSPFIQPSRTRQVRLKRRGNLPLGFSIRGGCEHGTGIFVSEVQLGSEAHKQGLLIGDQILRINGFGVENAVHDEVIALLKSSPSIVLKVKSVGVIPVKDKRQDPLTWKVVEPGPSPNGSIGDANSSSGTSSQDECLEAKVFISLAGASGLGCTVVKGPPELPGIFIQTVKPGGIAQQAGLEVGDQIIDMNGISFAGIEFAEAIALLKSSPDMTVTVKKGAGLDLFPDEKNRRYRPISNGVVTNGDVVTTAVVHAEDERSDIRISSGNHTNGSSTLHKNVGNRKSSSGSESGMSLQQSIVNGSVSVSERDVSISEVETEPGRKEMIRMSPPSMNGNGCMYRNGNGVLNSSSDTDSYRSSDTEVGLQVSEIYGQIQSKSRLSSESDEEREKRNKEEEEKLAEERRKLEEEQKKLREEAEKLAEEKRKWEEEKKQLESTIRPPPAFPPPAQGGRNFLAEMMAKAEKRNSDCSSGVINGTLKLDHEMRLRKTALLGGENGKNEVSTLKRKQHEMLMQEFQVAHRKMFGNSENKQKAEELNKKVEKENNKKNQSNGETFHRRQQIPKSSAPPPPPSLLASSPQKEKHVVFESSKIASTKNEAERDKPKELGNTSTSGVFTSSSNSRSSNPSALKPAVSSQSHVGTTTTTTYVPPIVSIRNPHMFVDPTSNKAPQNATMTLEKKIPPPHKPVVICPRSPSPPRPSTQSQPPHEEDEGPQNKDFPITDSRGPEPRPPPTFFDTLSQPKKGGPLVTIGTYTNSSRQNRFASDSTCIRPRQIASAESGSESPLSSTSSSPTPVGRPKPQLTISISSKSSVSSSSVNSSPRSEPKSPLNGYNGSISSAVNSEPQSPMSFRVSSRTHNTENTKMQNGLSLNSKPTQGTPLKNSSPDVVEKGQNGGNSSPWIKSKVVTISQNGTNENGSSRQSDQEDETCKENNNLLADDVRVYMIDKTGPLNMRLDGGLHSEYDGRIIVADIWEGGCIPVASKGRDGIRKGDQVLTIGNTKLSNVSLAFANAVIEGAMSSSNKQLKITVAKSLDKEST